MTKIREPVTLEKILQDVIGKLKENEIKEFTGKSISHFRKCSDPGDKDHNLHLSDAIKLDILSLKSQKGSPFLDNIGGRIGNLMDITEKALHPEGPKGEEISKREKDKIFNAISEVEEKIAKLKLSIK